MNLVSYGSYKVIIELRFADIQCSGGMAPPSMMLSTDQSTTQSTIPRYQIMHIHARISLPNMIPNHPKSQLQCQYLTRCTRLFFGGVTMFKEGDDTVGFSTTQTTNT